MNWENAKCTVESLLHIQNLSKGFLHGKLSWSVFFVYN